MYVPVSTREMDPLLYYSQVSTNRNLVGYSQQRQLQTFERQKQTGTTYFLSFYKYVFCNVHFSLCCCFLSSIYTADQGNDLRCFSTRGATISFQLAADIPLVSQGAFFQHIHASEPEH